MISMCWFWASAGLAENAANARARPVTPAAHRNDFAVIMTRSRDGVVERGEYKPMGAFAALRHEYHRRDAIGSRQPISRTPRRFNARGSRQFSDERKMLRLVPCPHDRRPNVAKGAKRHHELCHRFVAGCLVKVYEIIRAECHPDGSALHSKLPCRFARFVLPVRNVFEALEPLVGEVHQHDVLRHRFYSHSKAARSAASR